MLLLVVGFFGCFFFFFLGGGGGGGGGGVGASSVFAQLTDAVATATLHPCHTLRALLGLEARTKQLPMNVAAPADNVIAAAAATSCPAVSVVAAAASRAVSATEDRPTICCLRLLA